MGTLRKNWDWYEHEEMASFLEYLIVRYPPAIKKEAVIAFKEFSDKFGKLKLLWYEWEKIYREGRTKEEILKDIYYPKYRFNVSRDTLEEKRVYPALRKRGRPSKTLMKSV